MMRQRHGWRTWTRLLSAVALYGLASGTLPAGQVEARGTPPRRHAREQAHAEKARQQPTPHTIQIHPQPVTADGPRHPTVPPPPNYCAPFQAAGTRSRQQGSHVIGHPRWTHAPPILVDPHLKYFLTFQITLPPAGGARAAAGGTIAFQGGAFTIQLDPLHMPITANNVLFLACNGYYTGSSFDRVIPQRLVEGGLPADAGARDYRRGAGYTLTSEHVHGTYGRGAVMLASDGNGAADGRFLVLLDRLTLPPRYAIFGMVTAGMDALVRLSQASTTTQPDAQEPSLPLQTYRITGVTLNVVRPRH